jgi:ubiquinone/menaquinone biosynthesis C-methylase UbiE
MEIPSILKKNVKSFWERASCGEDLFLEGFSKDDYLLHSKRKYDLEPEILEFSEFDRFKSLKTLEIGVGLGSEHMKLAEYGAVLYGIDLTSRAVAHTKRRFQLLGLNSMIQEADAENLPFDNKFFDAVYSWGVIHHSPNTNKAVEEIYRVLKPGGFAKIMIYHRHSLVGYMLWLRYALFTFKPYRSLEFIYHNYLESPGTKAYSYEEAKLLFSKFKIISIDSPLGHGDLLTSDAGQRHRGLILTLAKKLWPRWFFKTFMKKYGLSLLITIEKSNDKE